MTNSFRYREIITALAEAPSFPIAYQLIFTYTMFALQSK
jgi:hypothetical protein